MLADRARRRAAEAEEQSREAAYAAEVAALLLGRSSAESELPAIAVLTADLLGVTHCWIELGPPRSPDPDEQVRVLEAGDRQVGSLFFESSRAPEAALLARVTAVLSALLATAIEREQLSRSDATKTAVLRSVSHDLRSPLTAIGRRARCSPIPASASPRAIATSCSRRFAIQARRLDRLVANLLDLSRLEAGAASPPPSSGQWTSSSGVRSRRSAPTVTGSSSRFPTSARRCGSTRRSSSGCSSTWSRTRSGYSSPTDPVEVRADGGRRRGGRSRSSTTGPASPRRARVDLRAVLARRRGRERGSGLGLAIARGFAELNGGRLWVESVPGRGDVLARVARGRDRLEGAGMSGARVLVVDDEPQILRAVQLKLRGAGYVVETAATAEEALMKAAMRPPEAIDPRPAAPGRQRHGRVPRAAQLERGADHRPLRRRRGAREDRGARRRRGRLRDEAVQRRRAACPGARAAAPHCAAGPAGARDRGAARSIWRSGS